MKFDDRTCMESRAFQIREHANQRTLKSSLTACTTSEGSGNFDETEGWKRAGPGNSDEKGQPKRAEFPRCSYNCDGEILATT